MYLRKMHIKGFRCIANLDLDFRPGMNVLIGENDTGKTAILDALRICLGLGAERREVYVTLDDFYINQAGEVVSSIEFDVVFGDLNSSESGAFYELLVVSSSSAHELQLHVRFTHDEIRDRIVREYWAGEIEGQSIPLDVLGLFYFVHLGALRDASRDLTPRRGNELSKLFLKLVPGQDQREDYERQVNAQIRALPELTSLLQNGKSKINAHLGKVSLRGSLRSVNIEVVDTKFRDIVEGLRLQIPHTVSPQETNRNATVADLSDQTFNIWQNGLGSNNIVYIATVLGDLFEKRRREPNSFIALLIEEPEAHLHPNCRTSCSVI